MLHAAYKFLIKIKIHTSINEMLRNFPHFTLNDVIFTQITRLYHRINIFSTRSDTKKNSPKLGLEFLSTIGSTEFVLAACEKHDCFINFMNCLVKPVKRL
mmetsp:Transcript_27913/g.36130  ORF Transcript_27913/g.36130 Transcript_27913/m.36130 type:complete len:100 (-) Transcript_27913:886-1185(-)